MNQGYALVRLRGGGPLGGPLDAKGPPVFPSDSHENDGGGGKRTLDSYYNVNIISILHVIIKKMSYAGHNRS